jgi:CRP/FNR family transcriptional regulator, cyclic AMP receptor protein
LGSSDHGITFPAVSQIEQNKFGVDAILLGVAVLAKTELEQFWEARLDDAKRELAMPRMSQYAPYLISQQNGRLSQPMRPNRKIISEIPIALIGAVATNESFITGANIFSQGEIAETVMYIQSGRVKLSEAPKTGKEAVVAILGPGDFLGEGCLAGQHIRRRTATAIAPVTLHVIARNEMIRALHADRTFIDRFLSFMLSRNIRIEEDLIDQLFNSSERRLARTLLLLVGKGNQRKLHRFAGISQATLATMIGTTRPRVNFFLNKFRKLGFIKYHGRLDAHGGLVINTSLLAKAFCK